MAPIWLSSNVVAQLYVALWLGCGPLLANNHGPLKCHHSMCCVGQNKNVQWPTFGWVLVYLVWFWLTSGIVMARLWPTGKQGADRPSAIIPCGMCAGWTCQVWARYGPEELCYLGRNGQICRIVTSPEMLLMSAIRNNNLADTERKQLRLKVSATLINAKATSFNLTIQQRRWPAERTEHHCLAQLRKIHSGVIYRLQCQDDQSTYWHTHLWDTEPRSYQQL